MLGSPRFRFAFTSLEALRSEVSQHLRKGRVFLRGGSGAEVRQRCALCLVHPESGQTLTLAAEAVFVQSEGAQHGIGFELLHWDEAAVSLLQLFVDSGVGEGIPPEAGIEESPPSQVPYEDTASTVAQTIDPAPSRDSTSALPGDDELDSSEEMDEPEQDSPRVRNVYDRVRHMSAREQQQLARSGNLTERIALERCFGGAVWEGLLQNPQLSGPEVAKICKKGNLAKPLLAQVLASGTWLAIPEVQRALLGNPRVNGVELTRVLRAMPRQALQMLQHQSAYRSIVKAEAKKLLAK
jgi:hypothetical protein